MVAKRKKIAQIVSTFPPYRGGMGNVAFHLADNLAQEKQDVTVFTPKKRFDDLDIASYFNIKKLQPQFRYGNSAIVLQLCCKLFKFDVVHFHYPFIGATLAIILAKLIRGKKLKLVIHYHMDLVGRSWQKWVFKLHRKIFLPLSIKFADKIIATSEDYLKVSLIGRYYLKHPEKFYILPNGVDIDFFKPRPKDPILVKKFQLSNKKVILFVGALDSAHYFKGINYLINAFKEIEDKNSKLIIVGDGDLRLSYQEIVDSYGLSDRIIFTGYIPDQELYKYYNLCDIFVLPSIDQSEAFGMVLLEAMSCSKPVISSSLPGVRKVVEKRVNGLLVKPKDANNLSEQINALLKDKYLIETYGKNGRKMVEEKYSWPKITEDLINLYNSL